jgi:cell division protein FtsB
LKVRTLVLLAVHLAVGATVVRSLQCQFNRRSDDVSQLQLLADEEQRSTALQAREFAIQQNILEALRRKDPYVIEMIARVKHGFTGPNEVIPPMTEDHELLPYLNSNTLDP